MSIQAAINSILLASAAALVFVSCAQSLQTGTAQFSFMAWNLVLSLMALAAAIVTLQLLKHKKIILGIACLVMWVLLLPNTFYMLTDFVHVRESGDINIMFDIVLIGFFAMNGFLHGLLSIYIVHKYLIERYKKAYIHVAIGLLILASSFAVDMGRYLRWNSWNVITDPKSLLFDISDTFIHPGQYDRSFLITGIFFVVISSLYLVVWYMGSLYQLSRTTGGKG